MGSKLILFLFHNCFIWNFVLSHNNIQTLKEHSEAANPLAESCKSYFDSMDYFEKSTTSIAKYVGGISARLKTWENKMHSYVENASEILNKVEKDVIAETKQEGKNRTDPAMRVYEVETAVTAILNQLEKLTQNIINISTNRIQESQQEIDRKLNQSIRDWLPSQVIDSTRSNQAVNQKDDVLRKIFTTPNITEPEIPRQSQDGGCGGVLIGKSGRITYPSELSRNVPATFRCIWTVRANLHEKVAFTLASGNVDSSNNISLSLLPLKIMNKENVTVSELRDSRTILGSKEYLLDGPVVFVTLISNNSYIRPSFVLSYEGRGGDTSAIVQYRHYHYVDSNGEVDYPRIRNTDKYSSNEMVTVVINPQHIQFRLHLLYIDLETGSNCQYDAFTNFQSEFTNYIRNADPDVSRDFRYCLQDSKLSYTPGGSELVDAFIVTFKSDGSAERSGFRFSWPYPFD